MDNITENNIFDFSTEERAWLRSFPVLSEKDFYPPEDNRVLKSGIKNIRHGDNYNDFLQEYNELCQEEEIYDGYDCYYDYGNDV